MSMKIVFIRDYVGPSVTGGAGVQAFKPLDEVFAIRKSAQQLIQNEMAISAVRKEKNPVYQKLLKEKVRAEMKEKAANEENEEDKKDNVQDLPVKRKRGRKKAVSKKASVREISVAHLTAVKTRE